MKLPPNTTGTYKNNGMRIPVIVEEIKNNFGNLDYTITPVNGIGHARVRECVTLDDEHKHLLELI